MNVVRADIQRMEKPSAMLANFPYRMFYTVTLFGSEENRFGLKLAFG